MALFYIVFNKISKGGVEGWMSKTLFDKLIRVLRKLRAKLKVQDYMINE